MDSATQSVERVLGSRIERRTPATWGSKNQTLIVDLSDGRGVVVQVYSNRDAAAVRLAAARQLAEPLIEHEVSAPRVLGQDLTGPSPWAAFELLAGEPVYVAARDDLSGEQFPAVARDMGRIARRFAALDPDAFDLPRLWADPGALRSAAHGWLSQLERHLPASDAALARDLIENVPALFRDREAAVCHGDFGPQNVLVVGSRVSGLLDLEDARIGDPLLDAAWWAWIVRAHTPAAFREAWSGFLDAAGIDREQDMFGDRVLTLIVLRILETADDFGQSAPVKFPGWATRLSQTLRWAGRPFA